MSYKRKPLHDKEIKILQNLKKTLGLFVAHIAKATERNKTSTYNSLQTKLVKKRINNIKRGAPKKLTKKEVNRILSVLRALIRSAKGRTEVTLTILMKRATVKVSASTFEGELHKRKVKFRRMRVKPLLKS